MRIVIAGATGLIGRRLTSDLLGNGHEVLALTRTAQRARGLLDHRAEIAEWDTQNLAGWAAHLDGADGVVNLAGESIAAGRWTESKKSEMIDSRLRTRSVIQKAIAAANRKPQVTVQASAVGYYGDRGEELLDEDSSGGDGFLANLARRWEGEDQREAQADLRLVTVRIGLVLSADGGILPRLVRPYRLFAGGTLGSGQRWFSWIHIADVAASIRYLIENPDCHGVYNLTSPNSMLMAEFSRLLGRILQRPSWISVPAVLLRMVFGEMADEALLSGQRVAPKRLLAAGYRFLFADPETALRQILEPQ